jgi:hypothetical protein
MKTKTVKYAHEGGMDSSWEAGTILFSKKYERKSNFYGLVSTGVCACVCCIGEQQTCRNEITTKQMINYYKLMTSLLSTRCMS